MRSPVSTPGRTARRCASLPGEHERVGAEALHGEDRVGERGDLAQRLAHEDERADVDAAGLPVGAPPCASGTR